MSFNAGGLLPSSKYPLALNDGSIDQKEKKAENPVTFWLSQV